MNVRFIRKIKPEREDDRISFWEDLDVIYEFEISTKTDNQKSLDKLEKELILNCKHQINNV